MFINTVLNVKSAAGLTTMHSFLAYEPGSGLFFYIDDE